MASVYCSYKDCNVTIGRESIPAGTLENPKATIPGRYYCSGNDYTCDHSDSRCELKKEIEK